MPPCWRQPWLNALCFQVVRLILISRTPWRNSSNLAQSPHGFEDKLIRFWWSKGTVTSKNTCMDLYQLYVMSATKFYTIISWNYVVMTILWCHGEVDLKDKWCSAKYVLAISHRRSSGTVTSVMCRGIQPRNSNSSLDLILSYWGQNQLMFFLEKDLKLSSYNSW